MRHVPDAPPAGPASATGLRRLVAAWDEGFLAFCDAARVDAEAGAELATRLRLLPGRTLTEDRLVELAGGRTVPTTELARRWQVDRHTVADWRTTLGLERVGRAVRSGVPGPVEGVEVEVGPPTRLVVCGAAVRLGCSARGLVEQLVTHHPYAVADSSLAVSLFGDATPASRSSLHAAVYRLRRHLPENGIIHDRTGYRWNALA